MYSLRCLLCAGTTVVCQCIAACISTNYDLSSSYSTFPAQYFANDAEQFFNFSFVTRDNVLSVNVYFESLNFETQTTSDAYGPVALLSDIGGQLGLFMGVSVISVMEFITWLVDEFKFQLVGESTREKSFNVCRWCKKLWRKKKAKPKAFLSWSLLPGLLMSSSFSWSERAPERRASASVDGARNCGERKRQNLKLLRQ